MTSPGEKRSRDQGEDIPGFPETLEENFPRSTDIVRERTPIEESEMGDEGSYHGSSLDGAPQGRRGSLFDEGEELEFDLPGCPLDFSNSFKTVARGLRNQGGTEYQFPMIGYEDPYNVLTPIKEVIPTMDGVSKCYRVLEPDDHSLMTQPSDGYTLAFMARSIGGEVPDPLRKVLYFFHRVLTHIESVGLQGFAVPTSILELQYDNATGKKIIGVVETRPRDGMAARFDDPCNDMLDNTFDLANMMRRRARGQLGDEKTVRPAFSVRVGFTGCFFTDSDGGTKKELYCTVFVTPLANFTLLRYIYLSFLAKPVPGCADFIKKHADWSDMYFLWRLILQYEAFSNLVLPTDFGDPMDYRSPTSLLLTPLSPPSPPPTPQALRPHTLTLSPPPPDTPLVVTVWIREDALEQMHS